MKSRTYRFFKISLLIVFIVCVALLAAACDEHTHSYNRTITKAPTCTEKGEVTLVCDCGDETVLDNVVKAGADKDHATANEFAPW